MMKTSDTIKPKPWEVVVATISIVLLFLLAALL
jgi:hypothetical protein